MDWIFLKMPVFGPLFRKVALSRFSRTFSTLIRSGVPILGSLEIVAATSGNAIISDAVLEARESVKNGNTLADPLAKSWVFPPMVTRMINIGEKSGALEGLLEKISTFYDEQVSAPEQNRAGLDADLEIVFPIHHGVLSIVDQGPKHGGGKQQPEDLCTDDAKILDTQHDQFPAQVGVEKAQEVP